MRGERRSIGIRSRAGPPTVVDALARNAVALDQTGFNVRGTVRSYNRAATIAWRLHVLRDLLRGGRSKLT
jgi:hypothetical protein